MNNIIKKLYKNKFLSYLESRYIFKEIINGNINSIELTSIIIYFKIRRICSEEIAGIVSIAIENKKHFPITKYDFVDITGTGGDNSNSFNISTISSFVCAACGIKVIKHGNYSISSKFGSFDILKSFGINLNLNSILSKKTLDKNNICFLLAPKYNNSFKNSVYVRKILKTNTVFNIIGPLVNPALPKFAVIGVYEKKLLFPIAKNLIIMGYKHAMIIYGNGLDEISLSGINHIIEVKNCKIKKYKLTYKDFGCNYFHKNDIVVSDYKNYKNNMIKLLQGKGNLAYEETIAANVSMVLKIFKKYDFNKGTKYALKIIRSGKPYKHMIALIKKG